MIKIWTRRSDKSSSVALHQKYAIVFIEMLKLNTTILNLKFNLVKNQIGWCWKVIILFIRENVAFANKLIICHQYISTSLTSLHSTSVTFTGKSKPHNLSIHCSWFKSFVKLHRLTINHKNTEPRKKGSQIINKFRD